MKGVSLHHHTTFSYGDGFGTPRQHAERAAELEMSALANTEHGNVSSFVQHEKACLALGIKPLFGCELYTAPADMRETKNQRKWHQIALAMDAQGLRNLNRLVSRSWDEGFYQWPTVSGAMLAENHEGLIVTSGCSDSLLSCTLLGGKGILEPSRPNIEGAREVIRRYKRLLGDRYYIEVQRFPELERTRTLNPIFATLAIEEDVELVATADAHYPYPDDNEMQKILHAASRNTGTVAAAEASWEYDIRLTFPLSDEQWIAQLEATGIPHQLAVRALENTAVIANRCNVTLPKSERIRFPLPAGYSSASELIWDKIRDGWKYRWSRNAHMRANKVAYINRLKYEMSIIEPKDFSDYFLMLADAVTWCKDIASPPIAVGPARGSAAGSLTCYMLRITEVNPMLFPTMMFERFIDLEREDLPDVDLDFQDDRRDEVRLHLVDVYGADHVSNIGTFTRYRGKNAINDVGRVYGIPVYDTKVINDLVVERSGGDSRFDASLADTRDMFPQAAAMFEAHPQLENAIRLEGNYKSMGVHAAGIVVSNSPINDTCAVYTRTVGEDKRKLSVIAYDKKDSEYLGMLKADFLGLTTMGMIARALEIIGMSLDQLYQVPLDDPETIDSFRRADVVGVFQFEGRATRLMTKDVKPDNFLEIADINALSRPGPLFSGASAMYVDIKHGRREPEHLHPIVDKWAKFSNYQIIYQEQVLMILREMGGFPGSVTGALRKIISLKLGEAQFNEWYDDFINGAKREHSIDAELADRVWRLMVTSATYSFNIAHCVSYGMIAYWMMWIKVHYPLAFYSAVLYKIKNDKEHAPKIATLIRDANRHDIAIKPPSLAISGINWEPDQTNNAVVAGFKQVPGIDKTAIDIVEWRDSKPNPESLAWFELTEIKGIGDKTADKIQRWAESDDPFGLLLAKRILSDIRTAISRRWLRVPHRPTHTSDEISERDDDFYCTWMGLPRTKEYKDYIEDERARSGKTEEQIRAEMNSPELSKSAVVKCFDDGDEDVYLRFNRFKFPHFKEQLETLRTDNTQVVIAYGLKRGKGFGNQIQVRHLAIIDIEQDDDEEESDGA